MLVALICSLLGCTKSDHIPEPGAKSLPDEMLVPSLERWDLGEYLTFLRAGREMQIPTLEFSELVEFHLLESTVEELNHLESIQPENFDYERYDNVVASIRDFIKLRAGLPFVKRDVMLETDDEILKEVLRLAKEFQRMFAYSLLWLPLCFSVLLESCLHDAAPDIPRTLCTIRRYDTLHAVALNGNFEQLCALAGQSGLPWDTTINMLASSIARSGSVDLFRNLLNVSSFQAFPSNIFCMEIIRFNRKNLFLEYVQQLKLEEESHVLDSLRYILDQCCEYQRLELVRVLVEHNLDDLMRIDLKPSLEKVIKTGNNDLLKLLLWDAANSKPRTYWDSYPLTVLPLLLTASRYGRVDMLRFMLSLGPIEESDLLTAFSNAVLYGQIEVVKLLLESRQDGENFISDLRFTVDDATLKSIGSSGHIDVLELFSSMRDEGDSRFRGFSMEMNNNVILRFARLHGKDELVKYLLRHDPFDGESIYPDTDPEAQDNRPLFPAIIPEKVPRQDPKDVE